jgi:hypothetical protein
VTERITLAVKEGIGDKLIALAGSSRKQGEYLSGLIEAVWQNSQVPSHAELNVEALRLQLLGLSGTVKMHEGRLLRLEQHSSVPSNKTPAVTNSPLPRRP